ncbi:FecR family protein [Bordetella sp. BOR01]|uniref:FecR family protein n=1 Tax=Bordetella sp. BOR01 TaxID=2854779 RepID=UPI001C46986E|nr:FecR family protein [Bordetella sp. BOR01]MBV7486414.1 FecR family protein [Bordetella sp. BOR01]
MNDPIDSATTGNRRDLAAYWFTREQSGAMSAAERQQFVAWRQADPLNERQYRHVQALWDAAGQVPASRLRALGYAAAADHAPPAAAIGSGHRHAPGFSPGRRRIIYGMGATCAVAAVGSAATIGAHRLWRGAPDYEAAFSTNRGEQRREQLPDSTQFDLNTGTTARVQFYDDRRNVALAAGEILCRVAPDPNRPFVVDADTGSVRTLGACFNMRREGDTIVVTVAQGEIELSAGPWWRRQTTRLAAGWEASAGPDGIPPAYDNADVAAKTAWRDGQIVFRGTPLSEAVAELNRYLDQPVLLRDPKVRGMRISGIFRIDDPGALLAALPRIMPVQVQPHADGRAEIVAR